MRARKALCEEAVEEKAEEELLHSILSLPKQPRRLAVDLSELRA